jgi:hypothetical protein
MQTQITKKQGSLAKTANATSSSPTTPQPTKPCVTHLQRPTLDGASKEGRMPMGPPSSNPKDFEHSPGTEVGAGRWDLSSTSRKVNSAQCVAVPVVKDQGFLPAPIRPAYSHKTSALTPRTLKINKYRH